MWYKSGLAWRGLFDLGILLVVFYMPLAREWTHWSIASQVNFFTIHLWILRVDLRAYGQLDHNGMFMMTRSNFQIYVWSLVGGWFIDANAVSFQVWHLSSNWTGDQDDISEQRIQLVIFGLMLVTTGIRTLYFAIMYADDPSKFSMHPRIVAEVAHHASMTDETGYEGIRSDQSMGIKQPQKKYKPKPTKTGETSTGGELVYSHALNLRGSTRAQLVGRP